MVTHHYSDGPRLLADIGGTNARFALELGPGQIVQIARLACADHARFEDALRAYLAARPGVKVRHAIVAIANPIDGDRVVMTNHDWQFSIGATRAALGFETLLVVNDFAALAMSVPALAPGELERIGGGSAQAGAVIGLVGAGTGLGVAGLIPADGHWMTLQSEGGHVTFSPADERELAVLTYCWERYPHVSAERLVSGPGIALIHQALAHGAGDAGGGLSATACVHVEGSGGLVDEANALAAGARASVDEARISTDAPLSTETIVERALAGSDPLCVATLDCFCGMLGTVAANVAVTLCARGGIYIGGGVVPRLGSYFACSPFRARFESKGRFSSFTAKIPTFLITAPYPALLGGAALLSQHLADAAERALTFGRGGALLGSTGLPPAATDTELRHAPF